MANEKLLWAKGSLFRFDAKSTSISFKNRMLDPNPVFNEDPVSAVSRPAMKKFAEIGVGPVRSLFSAPGLFSEALFGVSGMELYRVETDGSDSFIAEISSSFFGDVSWAAVANVGDVPPRLFFTDGGVLWVYAENGEATGRLVLSANAANGDDVVIDGVYYNFTTGSVDAGAPAGTAGNPWNVAVGATTADSVQNLYDAINDSGVAGTAYSTALTEHATVRAHQTTSSAVYVSAKTAGAGGNSIATTETGANMAWDAATLQNGGTATVRQVTMPDDIGAISVAHINSYVIVVPVQDVTLGTIGRFYWIEPGETYVDPINFATAERAPDKVHQVGVFGNMFWLCGQTTTEPWLVVGDIDAPMQRYQSILFDRGSWEGTMVVVKDSVVVTDQHGGVFQIKGGDTRISRPDIEARIRRAMAIEVAS